MSFGQVDQNIFVNFGRVQNVLVSFRHVENTLRFDKTLQLHVHQRIRWDVCNVANRERKQTKIAGFSFILQLCTLSFWTTVLKPRAYF